MRVDSLHIYPVKGCRAVDLAEAAVERRGLAHDRRWMIVDRDGKFMSQREHPGLATIETGIDDAHITLSAAGAGRIRVPLPAQDAEKVKAVLWKQDVEGYSGGAEADRWLGEYLGVPCRLVWQGGLPREVSPKYSAPGTQTSYADGFPLLITATSSLKDLNNRMPAPLPMNRFRPNIVIGNSAAWEEDRWKKIRVGGIEIDISKPCTRCVVTTTDQKTGAKDSPEPLKTLKGFRLLRTPDIAGVVFGWNAVPVSEGRIKTGDSVEVLATQQPPAFASVG